MITSKLAARRERQAPKNWLADWKTKPANQRAERMNEEDARA